MTDQERYYAEATQPVGLSLTWEDLIENNYAIQRAMEEGKYEGSYTPYVPTDWSEESDELTPQFSICSSCWMEKSVSGGCGCE